MRDGIAALVTDAAEVADLVGRIGADAAAPRGTAPGPRDELDQVTSRVLDALPVRSGRPIDRLCVTAGLDPASVQAALGRLALLGLAERDGPGWRVARAPTGRAPHGQRQAAAVVRRSP